MRSKTILLILALILGLLFNAQIVSAQEYASDEVIVKYKAGSDLDKIAGKHKAKASKKIDKIRVGKIKLPPGKNVKSAILEYQSDPDVEYAEPNYRAGIAVLPNDYNSGQQWGIPKINVDDAWNTTTGSGVTIAILDTGVDADHPDLAGHLLPGFNAITGTTNANDDHGHGTHVAGIAAGIINNATGIAGVAGNSNILPVKVLGTDGKGYYSDWIEGVTWATDNGAKVINMSLGGTTFSQALQDGVDYAYNQGVIVIAAAGNSSTTAPHYPASLNHVVSVVATDTLDKKATFSNYGTTVDISAPGTAIYSTFPNHAVYMAGNSYATMQGTSMATPFVAGVAALVLSERPGLSPGQLESVLENSAKDLGTVGRDNVFGYGLVDALAALSALPDSTPPVVSNVADTPDPFGPLGTNTNKISFKINEKSLVKLEIYDSGNSLVKTLLNNVVKPAGAVYSTWNGKNTSGTLVSGGTYTYKYTVEDLAGNKTEGTGIITVDRLAPTITGAGVSSGTFSPSGVNTVNISYTLSESAKSTIKIYNSSNVLIKTLITNIAQDSGANTVTWDGKTSTGIFAVNGAYKIKINATDYVNLKATEQIVNITINRTNPLFTAASDTPDPFKVTGTTLSTIKYTVASSSPNADVNIKIYNNSGTLVRTLLDGSVTYGVKYVKWNGKNDSGTVVPSGTYTYKINGTDSGGVAATEVLGTIAADSDAPTVSGIVYDPFPFAPDGVSSLTVNYDLSENAKITVGIYNSAKALVKTLQSNVATPAGANAFSWNGKNASNVIVGDGQYTIKITATDYAGLVSYTTATIIVEKGSPVISSVSSTPSTFKPTGTSVTKLKYTISENASVVITVKDAGNTLVRDLFSGSVTSGIKYVAWNGKNNAGSIVGSGVYTYTITATDTYGNVTTTTGTVTIDVTPPDVTGTSADPDPLTVNGTNLVTINYTLSESAKITVMIYNSSNVLVKVLCSNVAKTAGANSITWNGKNRYNIMVPAGTYTYKITAVDSVALKTIVSGTFVTQ